MGNFYETKRALSEYLLFHYGSAKEILPHGGPADALFYPVRCISECLDIGQLPVRARGLDLGCATGRSTFEMARHCAEVIGIDFSHQFIRAAERLRSEGKLDYTYIEEGEITRGATAFTPQGMDRERVRFEQGDAQHLRPMGLFDLVLMANLIDRLPRPKVFLQHIHEIIRPGGQLILSSPYTWLAEYTPREEWLGGFEEQGKTVHTFDSIRSILQENFQMRLRKNLPFLIREHARKYQWSVAEATVWIRNENA
ncbi:MAG TPA: putative 4-mercaptohistidine N1-methyltransferase [Candidatus Saccharimonadales bacterium]|nr:putative 4-mercaptohistidine N1-methyltransferase [Candidatus Saccharimonadales bacterium]